MGKTVDIIKKDFQELFPTIIGDEEGKLSIDDLMETSHDYIINEIQNLSYSDNQEKADLISFLKLMETSEDDIEYDSHVHYQLKRISEKYPDYKTFRFCEYRYVLNTIISNTDSTKEFLTNFYDKVFSDHTLMNLTDFIQESGLGNSLILLNEVNDEIINILEDAFTSYPKKIVLLWITAILYRIQGKYQKAIKYNQQFLEKLQQNPQEEYDFDFVDEESEIMVCYQLADLNFTHGSIEESLLYCNRVINMDQDKERSIFYYDTLIIRMRIHMAANNRSAFQQDYAELLEVITEKELNENYKDILDFRNN